MARWMPFLCLFARPMMILSGLFWVFCLVLIKWFTSPTGRIDSYTSPEMLGILILPGLAGLLISLPLLELQASSFALTLPNVRERILKGFVTSGLVVVALVVVLFARDASFPFSLTTYFAMGMAAYCLGGSFRFSGSEGLAVVKVILFVFLIILSETLARLVIEWPWVIFAISLVLMLHTLHHSFSLSAFRTLPLLNLKPQNAYSKRALHRYYRRRAARFGPSHTHWQPEYLGRKPGGWVSAAWHETYGGHWLKFFLRAVVNAWGVLLIFLVHVWLDKGDDSVGQGLAWAIYDALMSSPHDPVFGPSRGLAPLVAMVMLTVVAQVAITKPVDLNSGMFYPVSRLQRAEISFGGSLRDLAVFLIIVAPGLLVLGQSCGYMAGFEPRFDYMPFFFRALMVALILMPFAYASGQHHRYLGIGQDGTMGILIGFGIFLLLSVGCTLIWLSPRIFTSPLVEYFGLLSTLVLSRLLYRKHVSRFFRESDFRI